MSPMLLSASASGNTVSVVFVHASGGNPYKSGNKPGYAYSLFMDGERIAGPVRAYRESDAQHEECSIEFATSTLVYGDVSVGASDSRSGASPLSNSVFASAIPSGTGVFAKGCKALSFEDCEFDGMSTVLMARGSSVSISRSLMVPAANGTYYDFDKDSVNVEFGNEYRRP